MKDDMLICVDVKPLAQESSSYRKHCDCTCHSAGGTAGNTRNSRVDIEDPKRQLSSYSPIKFSSRVFARVSQKVTLLEIVASGTTGPCKTGLSNFVSQKD
jgi:hypothetical protein